MKNNHSFSQNQGSSVGIASGYGLDDRAVGVRAPIKSRIIFYSCHPDRLWVHLASYSTSNGCFPSGIKQPGREDDCSPPASTEVKKTWIYTYNPANVFTRL
jgi:hypothetical protein